MSKPYDWIDAAHVDPEHTTWIRWQSSGSPEHDAGHQSMAATGQCQAFAREDVQKKSATHQNMFHLPPIIKQHAGRQLRLPLHDTK